MRNVLGEARLHTVSGFAHDLRIRKPVGRTCAAEDCEARLHTVSGFAHDLRIHKPVGRMSAAVDCEARLHTILGLLSRWAG